MTIHRDVWGNHDTMHMHGWSDGGGTYGSVIELVGFGEGEARVTLIGDSVETYSARRVTLPADAVAVLVDEYPMTADYAGVYASDLPAIDGVTADDYVILSHGVGFTFTL